MKDLLYSLMLESHNDSAVMIAEAVAGSVEKFAEMMNRKAEEIGCPNTFFVTPNGLDAVKTFPDGKEKMHATTAEELARIMRYCVRISPAKEEFLKITQTMDYGFSDIDGKQYYSCVNHNALLSMMPGVISGKTGFTGGAGYSYVGALKKDGRTFVLALLGCGWPPHKTYKWSDAGKLFSYGEEAFWYKDIFRPQPDVRIAVRNGAEDQVEARALSSARGEREYRVLLSENDRVEVRTELPDALDAPVKAREIVGKTLYFLNGTLIWSDPFYTLSKVEKWNYRYCFVQILQKFRL